MEVVANRLLNYSQGCGLDPTLADSGSDSDSDLTKSTPTLDRLRLRLRPISSGKHLFGQDPTPFRFTKPVQSRELREKRKRLVKMVGRLCCLTTLSLWTSHFAFTDEL